MVELKHFKIPELGLTHASLPGINKIDWISIDHNSNIEDASMKMSHFSFDVLPIEKDKRVVGYYNTKEWGHYEPGNIKRNTIEPEDSIYYLSNLDDVIHEMARFNRKFYFLDNHSEVVGLITIGNLNSKFVYRHFYNLILNFEKYLLNLIYGNGINDDMLVDYFENHSKSSNKNKILGSYKNDKKNGVENNFLEYMYLSDYYLVLEYFGLLDKLSVEINKNDFTEINKIRLCVAHPSKTLFSKSKSLKTVSKIIKLIHLIADNE